MNKFLQKISVIIILLAGVSLSAQNVGINATGAAPDAGSLLDISSTNKGLLIPRVSIANLTTIAPIVGSTTTSMLVYNTNAGTGLGYYYWDGNDWINLSGSDWKITGNANTTSGTNFLGTTNGQALDFRTNNAIRFRVANGYQVHAMNNGTAAAPFYSRSSDVNTGMYFSAADQLSFSEGGTEALRITNADRILALNGSQALPTWSFIQDPNTGMWRSAADELAFSASGVEFLVMDGNGADRFVVNDNSTDIDFIVESNGLARALHVDGGQNAVTMNRTPTAGDFFSAQGSAARPWVINGYSTLTTGGALFAYSSNTSIGLNNFEGITAGTYSGVWGLQNTTSTGYGVWGGTNRVNNQWGLYTDDNCFALGYFVPSDERLKKDVQPITNAIDDIMKLEAVTYKWDMEKNPTFGFDAEVLNYGFLAQDLNSVFPELVAENSIAAPVAHPQVLRGDNTGADYKFSSVNYTSLIPINIQATKEQQLLIEELQNTVKELQQRLNELENK